MVERDCRISIRVTPEEKRKIEEAARRNMLSMTRYLVLSAMKCSNGLDLLSTEVGSVDTEALTERMNGLEDLIKQTLKKVDEACGRLEGGRLGYPVDDGFAVREAERMILDPENREWVTKCDSKHELIASLGKAAPRLYPYLQRSETRPLGAVDEAVENLRMKGLVKVDVFKQSLKWNLPRKGGEEK